MIATNVIISYNNFMGEIFMVKKNWLEQTLEEGFAQLDIQKINSIFNHKDSNFNNSFSSFQLEIDPYLENGEDEYEWTRE